MDPEFVDFSNSKVSMLNIWSVVEKLKALPMGKAYVIDFSHNYIIDNDVDEILAAIREQNILALNLYGNRITESAIPAIIKTLLEGNIHHIDLGLNYLGQGDVNDWIMSCKFDAALTYLRIFENTSSISWNQFLFEQRTRVKALIHYGFKWLAPLA